MSVHYKFKSALEYDTVIFDGLHISVKVLKNSIIQQRRIAKNAHFDLQVTNAQTKEVYDDEQTLIPKNTSLLIARIPLAAKNKSKTWEGYGTDQTPVAKIDEGGPASKAVNLANLDASEDNKIRAMMSQSTQDYDPSNYMKIRGTNQVGPIPPHYKCHKCHHGGHWIKDCPLGQGTEQIKIKKSSGIPRSFMVPVEGPQVPGAMLTPYGFYAVPVLDHQTYSQKPTPPSNNPSQVQKTDIPEDFVCRICKDLLTDAVTIPCCHISFCDECIRSSLLESEDHECPDCHDIDISPGTLIPNRFLRNTIFNFKNNTGYVKKPTFKIETDAILKEKIVITVNDEDNKELVKQEADKEEKTIITEADSTEVSPPNMNQPQNQFPPQMQFLQKPNMVHCGPPLNFRLPPPGPNPQNFMHGMYNEPPRPMFEPARPPIQGPPQNFQGFPSRHRGREYLRGIHGGRTPPHIIDDPLEAFNRIMHEKDEREKRANQRKGRSFSRSSSRSYRRSPHRRSRSPRRRSRSRSKSFSVSRSRSRSFTPLNRASPYRDYSPCRRMTARYKSHQRSPSRHGYRYKDGGDRGRDREFDRDYERDQDYGYKRDGSRYNREKQTDYHYYDNYEREREKRMPRGSNKWVGNSEGYYPQEATPMYHQSGGPPAMQQVPNSINTNYFGCDEDCKNNELFKYFWAHCNLDEVLNEELLYKALVYTQYYPYP